MNKHVKTKVIEASVCKLGLILYENVGLQIGCKTNNTEN